MPAIVLRMVADTAVIQAVGVMEVGLAAEAVARLVILVVDTVTCHAIVLKVRSATIVSESVSRSSCSVILTSLGGEVGHLSRDCPQEATNERVCYKCKQPGHVQASCPN